MIKLCLATLMLALPKSAWALCTALLGCWCSVALTYNQLAFGTYNTLSVTPGDATGNIQVTCGGLLGALVTYDIKLGTGLYSSSLSPRKMSDGGVHRLNYDIYTTSGHSTIWGDGTSGTGVVSDSFTILLLGGTSRTHSVYGRIPGGQASVPPGIYTDIVTITLDYN